MRAEEIRKIQEEENRKKIEAMKANRNRKRVDNITRMQLQENEKQSIRIKNSEANDNPRLLVDEIIHLNENMNAYVVDYLSEMYIDSLVIDSHILNEHKDIFKNHFKEDFVKKYSMTVPLHEQVNNCHPFIKILAESVKKASNRREGLLNDIKRKAITKSEKDELTKRSLVVTEDDANMDIHKTMDKLSPEIGPNIIKDSIIGYIKDEQEINKRETENIIKLKKEVKEALSTADETQSKALTEQYMPREMNKIKKSHTSEFNLVLKECTKMLIYEVDNGQNLLSETTLYDEHGSLIVENALTETIVKQTLSEFNSMYKL